MKRPSVRDRLRLGLAGILLAGGCSRYIAHQNLPSTTTSASMPQQAGGLEVENPVARAQCVAQFDLGAVRRELATASPYATLPRLQNEEGNSGVCVIQMLEEARPGTGAAVQCAVCTSTALPVTPSFHGRIVQLGFLESSIPSGRVMILPAALPLQTPESAICPSCTSGPAPVTASVPLNKTPLVSRGEPTPRRKSFVDLTASPCFAHAADYHWLSGQVEHSHILGVWRLRYASVDESDSYGGSVTLVETSHVGYLHDGEHVRVEGHLVDPAARGIAPAYRISSFKVIDRPNE